METFPATTHLGSMFSELVQITKQAPMRDMSDNQTYARRELKLIALFQFPRAITPAQAYPNA